MRNIVPLVALAVALSSPVVVKAQDSDSDRDHPGHFVKDSAITAKIKTKLATDHITSLDRIHVDTDTDGVVWLSGSARSPEDVTKAESMARDTDGVRGVHNNIRVKSDD